MMKTRRCVAILLLALSALLVAACGGGDASEPADTAPDTAVDTASDQGEPEDTASDGEDASDTVDPNVIPDDPDCDPLVPQLCAMPFPSSFYLAADASRATGYTLAFGATSLPANARGNSIDPAPYRRMDGFGVGTPLVTWFPDLDVSALPDETRIADSLAGDAKIVLLAVAADGATVERVPYFAELDLTEAQSSKRALVVRPAVVLEPDTRYVVGMRGLSRLDGAPVEPSAAFRALRDATSAATPVEGRQAHFEEVFALLAQAGVERDALVLAWDFHTASHEALHGPLVHMRDDALARVGDAGPPLFVSEVRALEGDPDMAFEIDLEMEVPHYLVAADVNATSAWSLTSGPDGLPQAQATPRRAKVLVRIPHSALDGTPHAVMLHAHGLNGTREQIRAGWFNALANQERFILVGVDMIGMATEDVATILQIVIDMSYFPRLVDRLHQGLIEHLLVMRAMREGFDALPEIAALGVVVDDGALWFNGISQGGIYGATVMALATDFTRGQLGVPGANYSLLLPRSHDFTAFFELLKSAYRSSAERQLVLAVIQTLWDQVDPVSWYRHVAHEPLPDTPAHQVLLGPAKGDYQVAVLSLETLARSGLGVPLMAHYGRAVPLVEAEQPYPHSGSGIVLWDYGNAWPPPGPLPPPEDALGDPHSKPRKQTEHNQQMMHFLRTGEIIDVCGDAPCVFGP